MNYDDLYSFYTQAEERRKKNMFNVFMKSLEEGLIKDLNKAYKEDKDLYSKILNNIKNQGIKDNLEFWIRTFLADHTITELLDVVKYCVKNKEETGKWVWEDDTRGGKWLVCSCCGKEPVIGYDGDYEETDFCPNCGARMESEVEP